MAPDTHIPLDPPLVGALKVSAFGRSWSLTPVFGPLWNSDGRLVSVELLSRFTDRYSHASTAPDDFFSQAPLAEQRNVLRWQVELLTLLGPWCEARKVTVSLNINRTLALRMLGEPEIADMVRAMAPYLRLEISERFLNPGIHPNHDPLLQELRPLTALWLDDFGTGTAGLTSLMAGVFDAVKIDRDLFRSLFALPSGVKFLRVLTEMSNELCTRVIVEGVENSELACAAREAGVDACQGWLWPEVPLEGLGTLPEMLPIKKGI